MIYIRKFDYSDILNDTVLIVFIKVINDLNLLYLEIIFLSSLGSTIVLEDNFLSLLQEIFGNNYFLLVTAHGSATIGI